MKKYLFSSTSGFVCLFFTLSINLSGCLEAEEKQPDFGPETSVAEISTALAGVLSGVNETKIAEGEKRRGKTFYFVRNGLPVTQREELLEILKKEDKGDRWQFTIRNTIIDYDQQGKPTPRDPTTDFKDVMKPKATADLAANLEMLGVNQFGFEKKDTKPTKVTYHALEVSDGEFDPPTEVKNKSGCMKLPNCKIEARRIKWSQINWFEAGPEKYEFEYIISSKVPYYSTILKQCATQQLPLEDGRKIIVTQCLSVTDFDFGTGG